MGYVFNTVLAYSYRLCANDWLLLDFNMFQKRAYKREIRSRHSYVLLAKLLAEEERLGRNISKCNEDGTGEVYLGLPEGIVKVFSLGNDRFAISLVGAVVLP